MVQKESILHVLDNSGVSLTRCIGLYGNRKKAYLGNTLLVSVRAKNSNKQGVKKGEKFKALLVSTKHSQYRLSNFGFRFNINGVILLSPQNRPLGTKIKSLLPKELRSDSQMRLVSLSLGFI